MESLQFFLNTVKEYVSLGVDPEKAHNLAKDAILFRNEHMKGFTNRATNEEANGVNRAEANGVNRVSKETNGVNRASNEAKKEESKPVKRLLPSAKSSRVVFEQDDAETTEILFDSEILDDDDEE